MKFSYFCASLAIVFFLPIPQKKIIGISYIFVCFQLLEVADQVQKSAKYTESYGTLIEDLQINSDYLKKTYYPLYLYRRLIFASILILLVEFPFVQLALILLITILPVFFIILKKDADLFGLLDAIWNFYNQFDEYLQ